MLHFDATPIRIGCLVTEQFINIEINIKQNNLNSFYANISKTISAISDVFPLVMSHISLSNMVMEDDFNKVQIEVLFCAKVLFVITIRALITHL